VIVDAILTFIAGLFDLMFGWFEVPDPPDWMRNPSAIQVVFQAIGSMGVWFPTGTVILIIGGVFAARMVGLGIKAGRMALSLLSGGGGNAGG
jgi:hypothetical protein